MYDWHTYVTFPLLDKLLYLLVAANSEAAAKQVACRLAMDQKPYAGRPISIRVEKVTPNP